LFDLETMPDLRRNLKAYRWWDAKIPPLFALAYFLLSQAPTPVPILTALGALALFTVGSIGIAGFGHLLNDVFDMELDEASGAENLARPGRFTRLFKFMLLLIVAWLPWLFLPLPDAVYVLLVLEFVLFTAYSVPPIRLKVRGIGGTLADALYAHVIPVLVTWLTFAQLSQVEMPLWFGLLLTIWAGAVGLRHILQHQLNDLVQDRSQQVQTFAVQLGWERTLALINRGLLPVEAGSFLLLLGVYSLKSPWVGLGFVLYIVWELVKMRSLWLQPIQNPLKLEASYKVNVLGILLLSRFYESWLPLLLLVTLVVRSPIYLILVGLHLLTFKNGLSYLLDELPTMQAQWRARSERGA
jgi:4-hydroxybenzoate polyprenyltransferase